MNKLAWFNILRLKNLSVALHKQGVQNASIFNIIAINIVRVSFYTYIFTYLLEKCVSTYIATYT